MNTLLFRTLADEPDNEKTIRGLRDDIRELRRTLEREEWKK